MYGSTFRQANPRKAARAIVTAGLMCAPLTRADTYTPIVTPIPQAHAIES